MHCLPSTVKQAQTHNVSILDLIHMIEPNDEHKSRQGLYTRYLKCEGMYMQRSCTLTYILVISSVQQYNIQSSSMMMAETTQSETLT